MIIKLSPKLVALTFMFFFVVSVSALTPVEKHGQLTTKDEYLLNKNGKIVQLRGMSFYWSTIDWPGYQYYTAATVDALVDTWKCTVIRVAYNGNNNSWSRCDSVINQGIKRGIYVIIDWHSHQAHKEESQAVSFFTQMATKYKDIPNILFEPFNEPDTAGGAKDGSPTDAEKTWNAIRPYFNSVIKAIRGTGNNNLIIVGTPYYCQFPYIAMANPPTGSDGKPFSNIAYSFHFYAASHGPEAYYVNNGSGTGGEEANYLSRSLKKQPLFISEWGTTHSDGGEGGKNTYIDATNTKWWFDRFVNGEQHLSHCNWSVSDFQKSSAFNHQSTTPSPSGAVVKPYLTSPTTDEYGFPSDTGYATHYKDSTYAMPGTLPCYKYGRYWGANVDSIAVSYSSRDNADPREAKSSAVQVSTGIKDEYVVYQINASAATKFIKVRALSKGGTGTTDILLDGTKIGSMTIPKNAAWTTSVFPLNVSTGKHVLKFAFTGATATYMMNWFELTNDSAPVKFIQTNAGNGYLKLSMMKNGFTVSLPVSHKYSSYSLIGVDGRVVKSGDLNGFVSQFVVDNLSSGVWFIKIKGVDGSRIYKAIVNGK